MKNSHCKILLGILFSLVFGCVQKGVVTSHDINKKPRVIVSTDIGGTDPDDFQSMIHYLMYADRFQTEGLIASPHGEGRKRHIFQIIDLYEKDLPKLSGHSDFPDPDLLRSVVKQGAEEIAPPNGWCEPTEGSEWIIERAKAESSQPLWVLVWGGLEDVAQALHDAPEIAEKIRVYWIGGPNKKWSINAYLYIARNFPDLWMIEANSTYRGWFIDSGFPDELRNKVYYENVVKGKGYMGTDFGNYYGGSLKMGDTPSMAYLLHGDPDDPASESWGGSFEPLLFSAVRLYDRHTTTNDTIPTYSIIEWTFNVGEKTISDENQEIWMEIARQRIDGFYEGNGVYKVRFVPKDPGSWNYVINCSNKQLHGLKGEFISSNPWPGTPHPENIKLNNWWSDKLDDELYLGVYQGAKTISKWREAYLNDWAERLRWLK
jgi:hypothetical protein